MKLNDWMNGPPKWTNEAMGKAVGVDPSWISQVRNGQVPSLGLARRISEFTKGEVAITELLDINESK